ncbi:MAG: isochorismatase family protein, partial [Alphaproteobacteria bacterium]|nr:isochorismatase family protein [Alphaproteobacteria bacterium]
KYVNYRFVIFYVVYAFRFRFCDRSFYVPLLSLCRALSASTGATASACIRATVEDAIADGFRPIVVRECIGDRIAGAVEWNLYDIDAKFGDVESLDSVLEHLRRNA